MRKTCRFGIAILFSVALNACGVTVARLSESTHKVCQLTGASDATGHDADAVNRTDLDANLTGTDLGASFSTPSGLVFFLFGDTEHSASIFRDQAADSIAYTRANVDPERCIPLTFVNASDGGFQPPRLFDTSTANIPLGIFEVPTSGFVANNSTYLTFATAAQGEPRRATRSVLGKMPGLPGNARDSRSDFTRLYDLPADRLLNVSSVLVDDTWRPSATPTRVLFFGSGTYRASATVYLATAPLAQLDSGDHLAYFTQVSAKRVSWSAQSSAAAGLFASDAKCIGELSVTWNAYLHKWLMLYNCDGPQRGILYRTAAEPWGPWSGANVLFDPRRDRGYCYFIHDQQPRTCPNDAVNPQDNLVTRASGADSYGGEYGPYVIDAYTKGDAKARSSTIYFTMSTWNPYQVVLMKSVLVERREGIFGTE